MAFLRIVPTLGGFLSLALQNPLYLRFQLGQASEYGPIPLASLLSESASGQTVGTETNLWTSLFTLPRKPGWWM